MSKNQKRSYLVSAVTLALLFAAFLLVFRDALPDILANLCAVPLWGVLLLLVLGFAYEGMEAAVALVLLRRKKKDVRFLDALNTTFLGVFGNIATMGAGTLPVQSFYLYRRGIDAGGALGIMASEYVLHKISVLLYTTVALLLGGDWLEQSASGLSRYIFIGYIIGALIVLVLTLLYTWDKVLDLVLLLLKKLAGHAEVERAAREVGKQSCTAQHRGAQGPARAIGARARHRCEPFEALRALLHPISRAAPRGLHGAYVLADAAARFADAAHHERAAERCGRGADGIRLSAPVFALGRDSDSLVGAGPVPRRNVFLPVPVKCDHFPARGKEVAQGL